MLSNSSQRQLRLEFLETRVNPTRLWFAVNALPIPIGTDTTTAITLQVPDAVVVGDIDLWVNVSHERMDEISLRLRSPSGTIIQLATKQGGAGKGYQNTIFDDQAANTLAIFSDSEGQRYQPEQSLGIFQQLSAQGEWQLLVDDANLQVNLGSVNSFKLGFTTLPDDHGNSLSTATPMVSTNVSTWSESGSIENKGDSDFFRWVAPADATGIQVTMSAAGGVLRPYVELRDSGGYYISDAYGYSKSPGGSAVFTVSINPGAVYYICAQEYSLLSLGSYTITLTTLEDDHGSTPSTATPLALSGSNTWSSAGSIQYSSDKDWFRWTAPADAAGIQVTMDAAEGVLQPYVALDSGGNSISGAYAYSNSQGGSAEFMASIIPGAVYYIRAQNTDYSLGSYTITLTTIEDEHGSTPATATPLTVSGSNIWSSAGGIQYSSDEDWFRWTAPADATFIEVTMDVEGGVLPPYVSLLDSGGDYIFGANGYSDLRGASAVFTVLIIPGTVYYIRAASDWYGSLGSYTITLASIEDDHGSTPATATPLTLSGSNTWSSAGSIQYSNDLDWFRWTAPADATFIQVIMDAAGGVLRPNVELLDSNGNSISNAYAYGYSYLSGGSAVFEVSINPGAVYYIRSQNSNDGSLGSYTVTLATIDDDHGSTPSTATPLIYNNGAGTWSSAGIIQYSNDLDWFRWTAPTDATAIQVTMDAAGGVLHPKVELLDSSGYSISAAYGYSDSQGGSAVFTISINPGAVYYIRAQKYFLSSVGSYKITLTTLEDDHGSTATTATPVTLSGSDTWSSAGIIQYSNDLDWFRWTAPTDATGIQVTMDAAGGVLQPKVELLDSSGYSISGAYGYSDSQGGSAVFTISINPGAVYYIRAQRYSLSSLGSYKITLTTLEDDHGSTPATATPLALSGSGTWSSAGSIQYSNDKDWFRWTAPADAAGIQVTMDAAGGVLRPYVAFLDSGGNSIYGAYDYSDSQGGSAVFTISINPGAVYYIRAGRYDSLALGSYTITLTTLEDDHGSTPATATLLTLSGSDTWSSVGIIQYSNDLDWFRWTAPTDATAIQVTMDAAGGVLRPYVELLDSGGNSISGAYAYSDSQGGSAVFTISINPDAVYYICAQRYSLSFLGSYKITLTTLEDDHGSTPTTATPVTLSGSDTWSSAGIIQYSNDADWFRWTAPADAAGIQVTMDAAGGVLRPKVELLDSSGESFSGAYAYSNSQGGSAEFTASIIPGAVYYIRAQRYSLSSLGSYVITLTTLEDDHGSTPATATSLTVSGSGTWSSAGNIQYSNDEDWFRWTAPADAVGIQVTMDAAGGVLQPIVELLDSSGESFSGAYAYSDSQGGSAVFTISINPGAVYYIRAQMYSLSLLGSYVITLTTFEDDGSTPATATPLTPSGSGEWSSDGRIQYSNDEDWFRWTAPADAAGILVNMYALGEVLSPNVSLLDSGGNSIFDSFESQGRFALFTVLINPGAVYYIRAVGNYGSLGSYTITLTTIEDDHGSTPATATSLTVSGSGTWSSAGSIQYSNDADWFHWTAPTNCSLIQVTMSAAGGILPHYVELRDSDGNYISGADAYFDSQGGFAEFTNSIIPGAVYYIVSSARASGSSAVGSYTITLTNFADDYGSLPITAKLLPSLVQWSVTGEINFSLDHDWFKWVVPLGLNRVRITMLNMGLPSQRMVLSIRNMNQVELTGVLVLGGNRQAELMLDVTPGSIYYLDASSASRINSGIYQIFVDPIKIVESIKLITEIDSTDLNNGIAMAIISQPEAIVAVSTPSDGLATILLPAGGSAEGDVSNLAAIQVADEIIGGSDFVINSGGNAGDSLRDTIRNIKDAQEQLLIELRGFFAIIHTGALEMLLFDADGNTSRLPRQWKLAMAPWIDGVMMELHAVDRQAAILFDLTSSGLKRVTAIVPTVWFDTVPAFTLEYATPDADESTSPWWASVVLMIGSKAWRIKKKSRLKV